MIPLTLQEIAAATAGRLIGAAPMSPITQISDNSARVSRGSLFIALRGERFDGHDFLPQVASAGAAAALVHREIPGISIPTVLVADTRKALGQLGNYVRRRMKACVIAIGGSNGKTTTKHLVGSVLSCALSGTQSPKSFNNDIGVPLALLGVSPDDEYVVLELGTNHPGELSPLSLMAEPQILAITSIGAEHLEGFGDIDGVRREEASILDGLQAGGLCVVNGDDAPLPVITRKRAARVTTFGFAATNDLRISCIDCALDGIRFVVNGAGEPFYLPLPGRHNASNALVALAIGREMGLSDSKVREALANCSRPDMRMQLMRVGQITILNDAYNANPASMQAALETISTARLPGRRIAVLGEMRELGNWTLTMHEQIGQSAAASDLDLLICVGHATTHIADAATKNGLAADRIHHVPDADAAAALVPPLLRPADTVLLKGSRTIRLEKVADAIARHTTGKSS